MKKKSLRLLILVVLSFSGFAMYLIIGELNSGTINPKPYVGRATRDIAYLCWYQTIQPDEANRLKFLEHLKVIEKYGGTFEYRELDSSHGYISSQVNGVSYTFEFSPEGVISGSSDPRKYSVAVGDLNLWFSRSFSMGSVPAK